MKKVGSVQLHNWSGWHCRTSDNSGRKQRFIFKICIKPRNKSLHFEKKKSCFLQNLNNAKIFTILFNCNSNQGVHIFKKCFRQVKIDIQDITHSNTRLPFFFICYKKTISLHQFIETPSTHITKKKKDNA